LSLLSLTGKAMKKLLITAKELRELGYPQSPVIPVAMETVSKLFSPVKKAKRLTC
jgi:hypothetical protein